VQHYYWSWLKISEKPRRAKSEWRMTADFFLVLAESVTDESWGQDLAEVFLRAGGKKPEKKPGFYPGSQRLKLI
jgi:hypothetical protein